MLLLYRLHPRLQPEAQILDDVADHSGARSALPRLAEEAQLPDPSPLQLLSELEARLREVSLPASSSALMPHCSRSSHTP